MLQQQCGERERERGEGRAGPGRAGPESRWTRSLIPFCTIDRYQKLWKSYVKLRHLLANSPKVKQIDKQKLMQREVGRCLGQHHSPAGNMETTALIMSAKLCQLHINISIVLPSQGVF